MEARREMQGSQDVRICKDLKAAVRGKSLPRLTVDSGDDVFPLQHVQNVLASLPQKHRRRKIVQINESKQCQEGKALRNLNRTPKTSYYSIPDTFCTNRIFARWKGARCHDDIFAPIHC